MPDLLLDYGTTPHGVHWVQLAIPDLAKLPKHLDAKIICYKLRIQPTGDPAKPSKTLVIRTRVLATELKGMKSNSILTDQDMAAGIYRYVLVIQTEKNQGEVAAEAYIVLG